MKLSDFELEVMQVFWSYGETTAPEVHARIAADHQVTYSTVKTIIDRLEEKGAVVRVRQYGRTILYRPEIRREQLAAPMVKSFVGKLFGGNVRPLFSQALAAEDLTLDDIAYLERILAEKKRDLEDGDG